MSIKQFNPKLTKQHFSCRVYKSYFAYLRKHFPEVSITELCQQAGLPYEYFDDETRWVSTVFDQGFTQLCIEKTGLDDLPYRIGVDAIKTMSVGAILKYIIKHAMRISQVYAQLGRLNSLFSKVTRTEIVETRTGYLRFQFYALTHDLDAEEKNALRENLKNIFQNTVGHYSAAPTIQKKPPADLNFKTREGFDGFDIFDVEVKYEDESPWKKSIAFIVTATVTLLLSYTIAEAAEIPKNVGILIGVCVGLAWIVFNKVYFKAATQASDEAFRTMEQMDQRYATLQAAEIKQRKLSEAAQLFVPWEFLKILGLNDLSAARLGQSVEQKLSILFLDLRGFTKICENLSPRETFIFLNDFYGLLAPHIREHRGFIDKYSGDGIMAVFAKGPHDAVEAAMDILKTIDEHNRKQNSDNKKLRISIGIATGKALVGTLGYESQLAVSVVSNVVNIASKLEHYNRELKTCVLVDSDTAKAAESLGISHKSRGLAHLGGQTGNVEIFEILQEEEKFRIASALSEINEANKKISEDSIGDDEPSIKVLLDTKK